MHTSLEPMILKQLLREYYATTGRLLFWKEDDAQRQLQEQIMGLLLRISGKEEYFDACMDRVRSTIRLQTVKDCAMLRVSDGLLERELASYYDMRADMLKYYKIAETQSFDLDILLLDNDQAVIAGEIGAMRLGAVMSWLGIGREASPDTALRYWTVVAYTGDQFAMQALACAYAELGRQEEAAKWQTVREIFREADRLFTITVPERFQEEAQEDAVDTAQVILAVRRCCADDNKELLPIPLLLYAIDSPEDVSVKLQNLYNPPETYHAMLARRKHTPRTVGFTV